MLRVHFTTILGLRDLVGFVVFDVGARSIVFFVGRGRVARVAFLRGKRSP